MQKMALMTFAFEGQPTNSIMEFRICANSGNLTTAVQPRLSPRRSSTISGGSIVSHPSMIIGRSAPIRRLISDCNLEAGGTAKLGSDKRVKPTSNRHCSHEGTIHKGRFSKD
jgi:hypothetical protein